MHIHYSKKITQVVEGLASDFCPICRRTTGVEVRQVRMEEQINHVSVTMPKAIARMCYCRECKSQWALREGTIKSVVKPVTAVTLETLLAETYPNFDVVNASRLQQERTIRQNPALLDAPIRLKLIAEPFLVLENDVKMKADTLDRRSGVILIIGFLAIAWLAVSSSQYFQSGDNEWGTGLAMAAAVVAYSLYSIFAHFKVVAMRTNIYPRLAQCLAPLKPSDVELRKAKSSMKCRCAKETRLVELLPLIMQERLNLQAAQRKRFGEDG